MKYRPDIDGLRAIAVMAVIAFHGKTSVAPGGFVGVDIFLVISGYLITSRIRQGIQSRTFTLSGFYARRARRIFPALFTMLAILWALGLLWLLPGERYELAKETIASVFSVANLLFYSETGYFEPAALTIPLLHIWSLGVEEQFYLLLPLLIMFTKASWLPATFGGLIIASFAIYLPAARDYPDAAFYLLPMRIWEFLIGGIVAYRNFPAPRGVSDAGMGSAGLMLIALAILIPPALMPFAGAPVLAAATGAALIIASGSVAQNSVSRLLSIPPLNLVGRVSYSLYLWHWPVIVVLRRSLFEAHPIHPAAELTVVFA